MQSFKLKSWFSKPKVRLVIAVILAFVAGYIVRGPGSSDSGQQSVSQKWTCSMHPEIIRDKPGKCPKCGMDLIPIPVDLAASIGPRELVVSEEAAKLMEIETSTVERKFVTAEIRMVGKIEYDETRVKNITAWLPGRSRIERLFVDFTGITVKKGDHMVEVYSPELISAQAELLLSSTKLLAREKLRLLGLTAEQIEQIEKTGKPVDYLTIYAPIGGVVIHKNATEGMYVTEGSKLYTIADLSHLWVKLDAYESDLPWLQYGQEVEFTTEAYPGEVFKGRITFIDPMLNDKTRTVKVRVNVSNTDGRLKPDMFVRAVVRAKVAQGGMVMDPEMAGKWICPMHPSVIKTEAGSCDICGMDLRTTEEMGYVTVDTSKEAPLVIPASAPLITGKRAVVYVQLPDMPRPTFEGREVVLGPRAGDYYIVKYGLAEGDVVVTKGNFKIDSALQIQAKPSMMSAESDHKYEIFEVPDDFRKQLWGVVQRYFSLQDTLAGDDEGGAVKAAGQTLRALSEVDMSLVSGKAHNVWMGNSAEMKAALDKIKEAEEIEAERKSFEKLSRGVIAMVEQFGLYGAKTLYKFHCPRAFDNKGADWLQMDEDTRNPYFGASMLKCGQVIEVIGDKTK